CQHPNLQRIDSLKRTLISSRGIERINGLNALSEEYWWLLHQSGDSISVWALLANLEAQKLGYNQGLAKSKMNLGVAEIYRKDYVAAENWLQQARVLFEKMGNQKDFAWTNLWLCQTLSCENRYREALHYYLVCEPLMEKFGDWEGLGKAWAWVAFGY